MKTSKNLLLLAVALWGGHAAAQSRLFDRVAVDFPNDVNVAGKVLHAGAYEIRQLRNSASGARVLFITDKGGTGFEAEAATIPVLDNLTPTRTHLVLRRSGGTDYVRQVWIAGKNYGYEFSVPNQTFSSATASNDITLTATYTAEAPAVVAQNRPEPAREAAPAPAEPAPSPAPQQSQAQPTPAPAEQAQATPPQPPAPQAQPPQSEPAAATPPSTNTAPATPSANEDAQRTPAQPAKAERLPTTAMNWMAYLIGGISLLAAGALLNLSVRRQS